jgi:hypothetical protein
MLAARFGRKRFSAILWHAGRETNGLLTKERPRREGEGETSRFVP